VDGERADHAERGQQDQQAGAWHRGGGGGGAHAYPYAKRARSIAAGTEAIGRGPRRLIRARAPQSGPDAVEHAPLNHAPPGGTPRGDWRIVRALLPYLWGYRWRIGLALLFMLLAKLANVAVPTEPARIVAGLDSEPTLPGAPV